MKPLQPEVNQHRAILLCPNGNDLSQELHVQAILPVDQAPEPQSPEEQPVIHSQSPRPGLVASLDFRITDLWMERPQGSRDVSIAFRDDGRFHQT